MRMDRLTSKFQEALSDAQSLAVGRDHQFVEPVHLMVARCSTSRVVRCGHCSRMPGSTYQPAALATR